MNTTANVKIVEEFWSNQSITQIKKTNSNAVFQKNGIRIDILSMSHLKRKKSMGYISKTEK